MATQPAQLKRRPLETLFNLGVLGTLGDAELLEYFRRGPGIRGPAGFPSPGRAARADGPLGLPQRDPGFSRGRGCLPGHVPGAGAQGRIGLGP